MCCNVLLHFHDSIAWVDHGTLERWEVIGYNRGGVAACGEHKRNEANDGGYSELHLGINLAASLAVLSILYHKLQKLVRSVMHGMKHL